MFVLNTSNLEKGLEGLIQERLNPALRLYAETSAKKLEAYMKVNAKWEDRTSNARQTLRGTVSELGQGYRITLAHGMDYGTWLELAHEKRFAIIEPTLNTQSAEIFAGLKNLLGG